jgi:hypothetical protein
LQRKFRGVTGTLRDPDRGSVMRGKGSHQRERAGGATGAGIDDEAGFQRGESNALPLAPPTPKVFAQIA